MLELQKTLRPSNSTRTFCTCFIKWFIVKLPKKYDNTRKKSFSKIVLKYNPFTTGQKHSKIWAKTSPKVRRSNEMKIRMSISNIIYST